MSREIEKKVLRLKNQQLRIDGAGKVGTFVQLFSHEEHSGDTGIANPVSELAFGNTAINSGLCGIEVILIEVKVRRYRLRMVWGHQRKVASLFLLS